MYTLAVKRAFFANHYLIGGDWGHENQPHTHEYQWQVIISGTHLDKHGYVVDIVDIENAMETIIARFQNTTLNYHVEFADINPSLERFAKILWHELTEKITLPEGTSLQVKLWENTSCWAGFGP
ncbi:MAG TPA: 6-carboxytetrahydropterin synthase [Cellvibrionaceae bacterium]